MLGVTARDPSSTNPAEAFISAAAASLRAVGDPDTTEDLALIAYTLTLPSENLLSEAVKAHHTAVDPTAVHEAREQLRGAIASRSADALQQCYRVHRTDYALPFERSTVAVLMLPLGGGVASNPQSGGSGGGSVCQTSVLN